MLFRSVPALEFSTAWTSDTARADAIQYVNGVPLKSGTLTRRFVGTIRTMSPTTVEDSQNRRFVWNFDNQVQRPLYKTTGTGLSHTYTTAAWRSWNNDTSQRVEVVLGLDRGVTVGFGCASSVALTSQGAQWDGTGGGVGYDSVDITGRAGRYYCSRGTFIGHHFCQMVEYGSTGTYLEARLEGTLWC